MLKTSQLTPTATDMRGLGLAIRAKLTSHPLWPKINELVTKHGGTAYFVGGQVYRTLNMLEHGTEAPEKVDWDFFVVGGSKNVVTPPFYSWKRLQGPSERLCWAQTRGHGVLNVEDLAEADAQVAKFGRYDPKLKSSPHVRMSRTYELRDANKNVLAKVDIIYEEDLLTQYPKEKLRGLDLYLKLVPLTIQSIAVSMDGELMGAGVDAVKSKQIAVHNPTKTVRGADINRYATLKTEDFQREGYTLTLYSPKSRLRRLWDWLWRTVTRRG